MSQTNTIHKINVATATFPYSIVLSSAVTRYKVYGTLAMAADTTIVASGTPKEGMVVNIDYVAAITTTTTGSRFGDYFFKVFGVSIPYSLLSKKLKIFAEYSNSAWAVFIVPSADSIPFISLESLGADIVDDSTLAVDGTTGKYKVKALGVAAAQLATDAVEEAKIKAKAVSLGKMADLARGSIIVGNASGVPAALDAKTSAQVLMGDGTDIVSVAVSGDVTTTAAGVFAIGANKVLSAMIKAGELVNAHLSAAAGIVFTKMAALTASKIPVLNSSGFLEAGTVDATKLAYIDVTTPGTIQASKAVVVGASGKIDTLDITTPKFNGTTITATPAEINLLSGVTGNVQDQIDGGIAKISNTVLIADVTPTAATLKSSYVADTTTAAASITVTLPVASTVVIGTPVRLLRVGANAASFAVQGSDNIIDTALADQSSIACSGDGKSMLVICASATDWQIISRE